MDQKDEQLIEKLSQLPKVKDQQNKALLFEQIDQKMKGVKIMKKRNRSKWVVPSIATIAIASLAFIMIQSGLFNQDQITEQSMDLAGRSSELTDYDTSGEVITFDQDESVESNEVDEAEQHNQVVEDSEGAVPGNRLVYYNDEYDLPIYTIAGLDIQGMYAIPISLVDTAATGYGYPNDVYNRISTFVDEDEFGIYEYPFDEIEFIFSDDMEKITMRVADDFVFPDTATQMTAFINSVKFMFANYPATELNLETETRNSIDLGQIGTMETLQLESVENLAFKMYQYEDKERLLIPIPQTIGGDFFFTIDEALLEMQYDQTEFDITATIPADLEYVVDPADEEILKISFESNAKFSDNRETKEMIEAILMTAKSFGFSQVDFDLGVDLAQVNQFDLTAPISVPDGVNPILLH
ncbi:MAG TPA: hypothetical protein GXZ58_08735 [Bacilli bacterium]|nr:hypothetical protein [Bacilli bacterium]